MSLESEKGPAPVDPQQGPASVESETAADEHLVITDRAPAGQWVVDPEGSQVNFRARTFGMLPVNGIFERFAGSLDVDAEGQTTGTLTIETDSLQTGIDRRDAELLSASILDASGHPAITFRVRTIGPLARPEMRVLDEERMAITGELDLRGTKIELDFPVTVIAHGDHIHIEGKTRVDHDAAGLDWRRPGLIGKTVRVDVALTLRPSAG